MSEQDLNSLVNNTNYERVFSFFTGSGEPKVLLIFFKCIMLALKQNPLTAMELTLHYFLSLEGALQQNLLL